ncbi:hypothetical protein [Micromonospora chokoriensis]|uniref:hypothetical protein n=1 Tax=Micromonospora chokoriensis TaxID=356851 RepID=UPI000A3D9802|nr:hypothetical protein [Micromonospora chokoriensis]
MMRGPATPIADPPAEEAWDFGGYPYALEPLLLPPVDATSALAGPDVPAEHVEASRLIGALAEGGPTVYRGEPEELFWFRWITGHQVCFLLWRLMRQLLEEVAEDKATTDEAIGPLSRYVDGYSAMLLYTGSCTHQIYNDLIRPSMRLRHRAFSGSWAPDYPHVRALLRGRPQARLTNGPSELDDAVRLHGRVHDGVAARLVPDGHSLLNQAPVRRLNHGLLGIAYDSYFVTVRTRVNRAQAVGQLMRRLTAIVRDLSANGLYPFPDDGVLPDELRLDEVVSCAAGMRRILADVARAAAGGPAHRPHPMGSGVAKAARA